MKNTIMAPESEKLPMQKMFVDNISKSKRIKLNSAASKVTSESWKSL